MTKHVLFCGAAVAALGFSAPVMAQEQSADEETITEQEPSDSIIRYDFSPALVVSGTRGQELQIEGYTGAISILNADQLEQRQARDVADALRDIPGVAVNGVAGQTQIRLRGSEANHVLVLVDGIEVSDPFGGEFDIGTLQVEMGSRLEVLRGPQSALYGSDAIGGVVSYESASGGELSGFSARAEAGSFGTVNGSARAAFSGKDWDAALSATVVTTNGQPNARGGVRDIGRDSYTISGKGSAEVLTDFELRAAGRYITTEGDFNDSDFNPASPTFGLIIDSPETRFENEAIYGLVGAKLGTLNGDVTHDLSFQFADIARDTFGSFGRTFGSEGERLKGSFVNAASFDGSGIDHDITLAADWERERFRNTDPFGFAFTGTREIENVGLTGEYRLSASRINLAAAIRHDFNDHFADATTFRLGAGYDVTDSTRLRASVGTGIKNPGFYELFGFVDGRFIGNENLAPEKSTSWEVGVDQSFASNDLRVSLTYFDSRLEDEIFTTFPAPSFVATPANRETVSTQRGIEISADARIGGGFFLNAAYSYIDAEEDGATEVRRPESIASAALNWQASDDKASATLVMRYNGEAEDLAFTDPSFVPVREVLDDYTLVNFNGRIALSDDVDMFARVENILDERYEQVFSFVSPGRTATIGVSAQF